MKTAIFEWFGYNVKVDYERDDDYSVDIIDWAFESDDIVEELNLYDNHARELFEDELAQMVSEYECQQRRDMEKLKGYLKAKARRK